MQPVPEIVIFDANGLALRSVTLEEGFTTIGRYPHNGVHLDHISVSRDHGAFLLRSGVLLVEDHESMNGIYVNGTKHRRRVLYAGDSVMIHPFLIYIKHGTKPQQD